jgi:hypothetical protein
MSVLAEATGRGDVLLRRGVNNEWGVRWERSEDGARFEPVDMTTWIGVLELRSVQSELWLSKPVSGGASGLVIATVQPADTAGLAWAGRAAGTWLINMTDPDGRVERLGDGYFYLEA